MSGKVAVLGFLGGLWLMGCEKRPMESLFELEPNMVFDVTNRSGLQDVVVAVDGPCEAPRTMTLDGGQRYHEGCEGSFGARTVSVRAVQAASGYDQSWSYHGTDEDGLAGLDFEVTIGTGGITARMY